MNVRCLKLGRSQQRLHMCFIIVLCPELDPACPPGSPAGVAAVDQSLVKCHGCPDLRLALCLESAGAPARPGPAPLLSPQVGNLGLLFMLLFFIYAALGVELFGKLGE